MAVDTATLENINTHSQDEDVDLDKLDRGDSFADSGEGKESKESKESSDSQDSGGSKDSKDSKDESEEDLGEAKKDSDEDDRLRDDKGRFVPAYRAKEMVAKEREAREAAEQRLAELEKRLQSEGKEDEAKKRASELEARIEALLTRHAEHLSDGEASKAAEVMREIRAIDRQIALEEVSRESRRMTAAALESDRVDLAIARLEAEHPVLNQESPEFDATLANFVLAEQRRLVNEEGLTPSKALLKAGAEIIARFVTAADDKEAEKKGLTNMVNGRQSDQVKKNLDTQSRQPGSLKRVGTDSDRHGGKGGLPDVAKLSEEEFDALPEATKERLRGDSL